MGKLTRTCQCGSEINDWRACPVKCCSEEAVFCSLCGGDTKAMSKMQAHIFTSHTESVVSRRALIIFRARLLMSYYRDLPNGLDLGHINGYLFLKDITAFGTKITLYGEILPDIRVPQTFKWYRVAEGGIWAGYHALLADEPEGSVEAILPTEIKLEL